MIDCNFSLYYDSDLSVKRKIEKHREKVLRCDSLLQRNPFVKPVPSSTQKKSKKSHKEALAANDAVQGRLKVRKGLRTCLQEKIGMDPIVLC